MTALLLLLAGFFVLLLALLYLVFSLLHDGDGSPNF